MACNNGSGTRAGVDGLTPVRISYADYGARPLSSYNESGISRRANGTGWDVQLDDLLAPERLSEYGTQYFEIASNFCASEPPTIFPGASPGIAAYLRAIARAKWNELCECLPPPPSDPCARFNGLGQCPAYYEVYLTYQAIPNGNYAGYTRRTLFRGWGTVKDWGFDRINFNPPAQGSWQPWVMFGLQGNPNFSEKVPGGAFPAGNGGYNYSVTQPLEIYRQDGRPDNCCPTNPPPPEPEFPNNTLIFDYPPLENDDVIVFIPCPQGEQGERGEQGEQGIPGVAGEPGVAGSQGNPGRDGVDGERGAQGLQGIDGLDGRDGIDGAPGAAGADGAPGAAGADGAPGAAGADGKAATIAIRTITKIALDAVGYATNTGTVTDAVYDLFVPADMEIVSRNVSVADCNDDGNVIVNPVAVNVLSDGVNDTSSSVETIMFGLQTVLGHLCEPVRFPVTKRNVTLNADGIVNFGAGEFDTAFISVDTVPPYLSRIDGNTDRFDRLYVGSAHQVVFGGSTPQFFLEQRFMFVRLDPLATGVYFNLKPGVSVTIYLQQFEED